MSGKKRQLPLDEFALIIIGTGAALFYYYFEKNMTAGQNLTVFITMGIILLISLCTQLLINSINRSKKALTVANETLEVKVKERTAELRESEMKYRTIFENTGAATVILEQDMTISLANSEFVSFSGFEKSEIEDTKSWLNFIDEKTHRKLLKEYSNAQQDEHSHAEAKNFECEFYDKYNNKKDILCTLATIPGTDKSVASLTDITELKMAERQIYHQAFHDTLTGLPNRALFMEILNMAIKRSKRRGDYHFAVLYLDIDRFKLVNDSLGHNVGDKLLVAFANRIQDSLREIDSLARFGGDEFVILLEDIENEEYASSVAERLQQELKRPFMVSGKEVFAPASFGVMANTKDYDHAENIIRDADSAMYHAKEKGKAQFKVFDKKLHEKAMHLLQRETDLRKAIHNNQFENHYQPIVDLKTASLVGFEALIRWNHPQLGLINPGSFISIAEETGLIIPITRLVTEAACRHLYNWQEQLGDIVSLSMNVNISSKHFLMPSLLDDIKEILNETGLPPEQLKLEITETALMEDADETVRLVHRLKDFGLQLVIDDFGTGYSSLSYLQRLPIHTLKVDRSFVSRIQNEPDGNRNIVEAIISLAHRLNMIVVAEGVESPEQYAILLEMNCQFGQGYLFSRPLDSAGVDKLIETILHFSKRNPDENYALADMLSN
ncbi:MAG: EAL domain-containing protein [Deltaproteobacteria bacterium]|jgi:diguanylate cyclase (GGDEF)-like protein/PAS domain S-box-containing protein|nr:EAL domain-containing protein [Deltaproteobacteria bacterium]